MARLDVIGKIVNRCPKREFNGGRGEKIINYFDKFISVPQNRLLIGVSALASQPFIDLFNQKVDEKTRIVSCARTLGKIVSGTITGFTIRAGFVKLVKNYSVVNKLGVKNVKRFFTPSNAVVDTNHAYKQYQNAAGTLLAVAGIMVSNFLIDAPLTNFITNTLLKKFGVIYKGKEVKNVKS